MDIPYEISTTLRDIYILSIVAIVGKNSAVASSCCDIACCLNNGGASAIILSTKTTGKPCDIATTLRDIYILSIGAIDGKDTFDIISCDIA